MFAVTGASVPIAAGRLSYVLSLHGPSVVYDTACSSALAACHGGLRALQLSECTFGLVAGAMLILAPGASLSFAVAGMTSMRGRSHTFDRRADGYARGETCGGFVLHGGHAHVVSGLLGSAVRQDGRTASLTAPNALAQEGLLIAALADAKTAARALRLNEAHGTGTALGDPIEAAALQRALLSSCDEKNPLAVGGVKANTGHAEAAAGIAGLFRLTLGLRRGEADPNAQLRALNPHVAGALSRGTCALPVQVVECGGRSDGGGSDYGGCGSSGGSGCRLHQRCGVSSFGFGGTIAHTVLCCTVSDEGGSALLPLVYRRRTFPLRELLVTSVARTLSVMYATRWTAVPPASMTPSAPYIIMLVDNALVSPPRTSNDCALQ